MTQERKQLLESIGFKWAEPKGKASWNKRYNELVAYKNEVSDGNVFHVSSESLSSSLYFFSFPTSLFGNSG